MKTDNKNEIKIRVATPDDAEELLAIYAPYVTKTAISFECEVPGIEEFRNRMRRTLEKYPYLVAQSGGGLLGYAYTGAFVGRAAYDWSVETTIYVKEDQRKSGVGRRLYEALEAVSKAQNILNMNACIGDPEVEDEHLTRNSEQFHAHMGFRMVGRFHQSGYKFGTWYHMVWMEKILGEHGKNPKPVVKFPELGAEKLRELGL